MKKIIILFVLSLFMPLITSCYQNDKCTCCDEGFYTDPNEVPVHWDRGFYRNVVDLTDLGIRLGMREDGYYQVIEVNGDFSKKSNLVFPSHYEGIPIVGIGISKYTPREAEFSHYGIIGRLPAPGNDYYTTYKYELEFGENYKNDSISTLYFSTHHINDIDNQYLVKNDNLEKIVYMCNLSRNIYSDIPSDAYDYFSDDKSKINYNDCSLFSELQSPFDLIQLGYFIENNKDLVFVTTKEIKEAYLAFLYYIKDQYSSDSEENLMNNKIYEALAYKYFEKWLVEPNIYFYNNTSETDENIYWIDYEENGEIIFEPYDPYNEGYEFLGWYTEKECINEWDFDNDTILDQNTSINLYAKWGKLR